MTTDPKELEKCLEALYKLTLAKQEKAESLNEQDAMKKIGTDFKEVNNEAKQIYRKMAIKFHPDRTGSDEVAEMLFKLIANIYNY